MANTSKTWTGPGGAKFKIVDKGWDDIVEKMKEMADGTSVAVGIQGSQASEEHGEGMTNAELGSIHEYGRGVPQRSHWRSTFDENKAKYQTGLDKIAMQVFAPGDGNIEGALLELGDDYKEDVVRKIYSGIAPPLDPATVAAHNGESVPLLDTGQYINSFRAVVRDRDSIQGSES